jgi:TP901 family phage tail tape measure protein
MSVDAGTIQVALELRDEFTPKMMAASRVADLFSKNLESLGDGMRRAGRDMLPVSVALGAIAGASIKASATFGESMTKLTTIANVTEAQLGDVKDAIMALSGETGIGPQMLADAMMKVSSTTENTTRALEILRVSALGTKAGFGETVNVATALTAVLNSYASTSLTAAQAGDIMAEAIKLGGSEAKELAPTLANVVPQAAMLGVSFEEVAANLATLTKLGVPTSEAVTQLASTFTAFSKHTKKGENALKSIGMTYEDLRAQLATGGLQNVLDMLINKFDGNIEKLTGLFGRIEAVRNIMGTAGVQGETYAEVLEKIQRASSEAKDELKEMADAMNQTTVQKWRDFTALVERLAIYIGDQLAPHMRDLLVAAMPLVQLGIDLVKWWSQLSDPVKTASLAFVGFIAAAPIAVLTVGSALNIVSGAFKSIAFILGAPGAIMTWLGEVAMGTGLLATAAAKAQVKIFAAQRLIVSGWTMVAGSVAGVSLGIVGLAVAWAMYHDDWTRIFDLVIPGLVMVRENQSEWTEAIGLTKRAYDELMKGNWREAFDILNSFGRGTLPTVRDQMGNFVLGVKDLPKPLEALTTGLTGAHAMSAVFGEGIDGVGKASELTKEQLAELAKAAKKLEEDYSSLMSSIRNERGMAQFDAAAAAMKAEKEWQELLKTSAYEAARYTENLEFAAQAKFEMASVPITGPGVANGQFMQPWQLMDPPTPADSDIAPLGERVKKTLEKAAGQFPNIMKNAILRGDWTNAFSAMATIVGSGLGEELGVSLGKKFASLASFAGPLGSMIGSMAGPLIEMFGKMLDKTAKGIKRTAEGYGVEVTDAMVEAIKKSMKDLNLSQQAATILNIDKLFPTVTTENFADALRGVRDAFSMIATKQLSVAQGAQVIDSMWKKLEETGTYTNGRITKGLKEIIALNEQYKTQSKEIADFLRRQSEAASTGFNAVAKGAMTSAVELERMGLFAVEAYNAGIEAGQSHIEALTAVAPGIKNIQEAYKKLGLETDNAAFKALALQAAILEGNPDLIAGIGGLTQMMIALDNMGRLNVDTFQAMLDQGALMYQRLQSEAFALGGTTADALLPMQDYLHEAEEQARLLGIPLDANTQMLIDQSKELGIWKDRGKSANELMLDGINALVDAMNRFIGAIDASGRAIAGLPNMPTPPDPTAYGGGIDDGVVYAAMGGQISGPRGTDTVPAWLTPGERVLSVQQNEAFEDLIEGGGGSKGSVVVNVTIKAWDRRDMVRSVEDDVLPIITDALHRGLGTSDFKVALR